MITETMSLASPKWMEGAACAYTDPEVFFPEIGWNDHLIRRAVTICHKCPVEMECLEWSYTADNGRPDKHAILGGMTPRMRAHFRRRRAA